MHEAQSQTEAIERIWSLIQDIHVAMLTTTDPNGSLYSRPMATQQDHFTGELFFLTHTHSDKVDEIRDNSKVNLTYVDTHKSTFVSLSGTASLNRDRARRCRVRSAGLQHLADAIPREDAVWRFGRPDQAARLAAGRPGGRTHHRQ